MTLARLVASCLAAAALAAAAPVSSARAAAPPALSPFKTAAIPGATIGWREAGEGRPLVLIAGFGLTAAEWDPALVARLAAHRRVIVFDNRGVATSTGALGRLSVAQMAGDTARLIAKLKLGRADVLGWSMGGYIAQELALRHPKRVRRLVLAGTDPGGRVAVQPSAAVNAVLEDPDATPDALLPILFPADQQAAGGAWYQRIGSQPGLEAQWLTVSPEALAAQTRACGRRWTGRGKGTWSRLPRLALPVLVADGADDVVVPMANSRKLARRIPGARLRVYPDAGHAFLVQDGPAFAHAVNAFLTRRG